jgi:hypothetical protein
MNIAKETGYGISAVTVTLSLTELFILRQLMDRLNTAMNAFGNAHLQQVDFEPLGIDYPLTMDAIEDAHNFIGNIVSDVVGDYSTAQGLLFSHPPKDADEATIADPKPVGHIDKPRCPRHED